MTPRTPNLPGWAADAIGILIVIGTLAFPGPRPMEPHPSGSAAIPVLALIAVLLVAAALPMRRRWPVATTLWCLTIYCATALAGLASLGAGIATVIGAYSMASRRSRSASFSVGGIGAAAVAVLSITIAEFGVV